MFGRFRFGNSQATQGEAFHALRMVEDHWAQLRRAGGIPARTALDPRALQTALAHCVVLERIAPGMARIRVAGARVNDLLGMELRGMPLSALILPDSRDIFRSALEEVFDRPARAKLGLQCESGMPGQMLLLPLLDRHGRVTRALGCIDHSARPTIGLTRFGIDGQVIRPVSPRVQPADPVPASDVDQDRTVATHVPHLRLVVR
ncbi:PAS domain-containing protein [Shimia biformata]|uniref:PAS domain-containing protein n=1 Tax=Shimia biformata TaxID=1294299 RepID=UPI001951FF53|nr:PAS domain-containing protein [Shimia biformata]